MRDLRTMIATVEPWRLAVGFTIFSVLGAWIFWLASAATADPPPPAPAPTPAPAAAPAQATVEPPVTPLANPPPIPTTSRIEFSTVPPADATVTWGKTRLGRIAPRRPLVVVRPRDSGPLDIIVRAEGFLPVHTRAHTFGDTKVLVKLTKPEEKVTLLGYRAPLDAGMPLAPEAGALPGTPEPPPAPLQLMP